MGIFFEVTGPISIIFARLARFRVTISSITFSQSPSGAFGINNADSLGDLKSKEALR
jgi:hypothetical protein